MLTPALVRQQYRHARLGQDASSGAAQYEVPHPTVPKRPHYQERGADACGMLLEQVADVGTCARDPDCLRMNTAEREIGTQPVSDVLLGQWLLVGNRRDRDASRPLEKRKGVSHRPRG